MRESYSAYIASPITQNNEGGDECDGIRAERLAALWAILRAKIQPLEGMEPSKILMLRSVKIKNLLLYFRKPPIQSLVQIEKKRDIATGGYSGGRRQISDSKRTDGEEVRYKIYYPTEQWLCEFETDDSGTLTLPGPLGYGNYLLYEKAAPDGYILHDNPVRFSVETHGESPIVVSFFDQVAMGVIEIVKTGESYGIPMWRRQNTGHYTAPL